MASNSLPSSLEKLMDLAAISIAGVKLHGATIGLHPDTEARLTTELTRLRDYSSSFDAARVNKRGATERQNAADRAARLFLSDVRHLLIKPFGPRWNVRWGQAGFRNESTAIPDSAGDRLQLLHALTRFLAEEPQYENASLKVTAAEATALIAPFEAARNAFAEAATQAGQTLQLRDEAEKGLRVRLRGLIEELKTLLSDSDPRWYAFGLNAPADPATPSVPDGLVYTLNGTTAYLDWADSRRADRYRVWVKVVGVDAEFRPQESVTESDFTLANLPAGKKVEVRVTALNDAGESQPCAVIEINVP